MSIKTTPLCKTTPVTSLICTGISSAGGCMGRSFYQNKLRLVTGYNPTHIVVFKIKYFKLLLLLGKWSLVYV